MTAAGVVDGIGAAARLRPGEGSDLEPLLRRTARARFVLLGEASHGTHDFYRRRAEITKRLIEEQGVTAVAAEADWPDAHRVNCYVQGASDDTSAESALGDFRRFPSWMWRNADVVDFVRWLREWNDARPEGATKVGFYGLDLYSLSASIEAVLGYLDETDHEAARRARARYSCFDHFSLDAQSYGYAASIGAVEPCEDEVVEQLLEMRRQAAELADRDGRVAEDRQFTAEQNARLVRNAERYYRAMFRGRASSWNIRDLHMAETLEELARHLGRRPGPPPRFAVWAHNSHLGDARATEMARRGELNLGQVITERHARETVRVGFSTYSGTVTAASDWDLPAERKTVRPALPGSWEDLLHHLDEPEVLVLTAEAGPVLRQERLGRAIGVIYRPETERVSHYFAAVLADQFDAVIHIDDTRAVEPLEASQEWARGEPPETFPHGQ